VSSNRPSPSLKAKVFWGVGLSAAVALGVAGIFAEVHPHPDKARSDGPNSLPLSGMPEFIKTMQTLDKVAKTL